MKVPFLKLKPLPEEANSKSLKLDLYHGLRAACREFFGPNHSARIPAVPETTPRSAAKVRFLIQDTDRLDIQIPAVGLTEILPALAPINS